PPLLPPSVCWHCAPSLHDALPLSISWYRCSACSSCHFMVSFVFIGITSFAGRVPQGSGDSKTKSVQNRNSKGGQESLRNYKGTGAVFPAIPDVNFAAYRAATPGIPEVLWRIPADGILLISGIHLS